MHTKNLETGSDAALAATIATATTLKDRPFFDAKHGTENALDFSRTNLSEPDLLGTAEGGSSAPINQPLAPVAVRLGLQSPHEVRIVGAHFWSPRSVTPTHNERHFYSNVDTGDGLKSPL